MKSTRSISLRNPAYVGEYHYCKTQRKRRKNKMKMLFTPQAGEAGASREAGEQDFATPPASRRACSPHFDPGRKQLASPYRKSPFRQRANVRFWRYADLIAMADRSLAASIGIPEAFRSE